MKRSRGRNRKHNGNSANRSYDSNGPEVKIRGNASTIHEKYQALARDANASGDRVRSENLLQHAEHYFRIMKAAQANAAQANGAQAGANGRNRSGDSENAETNTNENEQAAAVAATEEGSAKDAVAKDADASEEKPQRKRRPRKAGAADKAPAKSRKKSDSSADVATEEASA